MQLEQLKKQNEEMQLKLWESENHARRLEKKLAENVLALVSTNLTSQPPVATLMRTVAFLEDKVEHLESHCIELGILYQEAKNEIDFLRCNSTHY